MKMRQIEQRQMVAQIRSLLMFQLDTVKICGWCPNAAERTRAAQGFGKQVSHGICKSCTRKMEQEMRSC